VKRKWLLVLGAVVALGGILLIASSLLFTSKPVDWLDDNAQKVDDGTYLADDPPLVFSARLADAVEPRSRYVDASGVALRYRDMTVTVTNGETEGTSMVYVDRTGSPRRYSYGRYGVGGWAIVNGFSSQTSATPDGTTAGTTSTRRGADFRGGGPGSGK
jgi:hypothetical protein